MRPRLSRLLPPLLPWASQESGVAFNSVGRATITLQKASNASWPRLLKKRGSKPGNMHTWHDMRDRFEQALRDFEASERNASKDDAAAAAAPAASPNASAVGLDGAAEPEPPAASPAAAADEAPAPTPEPTADPEAAAEAARGKELDAALKKVARAEAAEVMELRSAARKRKAAVDAKAREDKAAIDTALRTDTDSARATFMARRKEAMAKLEAGR